jgi:hypothetical protein
MNLAIRPATPWKVVEVEFQSNIFHKDDGLMKRYEYRTRFDVKVGDPVVVEVQGNLKVVTVMAIKDVANYKIGDLKWIVDVIDIEPYVAQQEEANAIALEEAEIERLAIEHRKIKAVEETFKDNPDLANRFARLMERKRAL